MGTRAQSETNYSEPFISVIVSFYNVAPYVPLCVDSLLQQTYNKYELILVDDGSTDNTGVLLDSYSDTKAVRILHTANRGLSAARNVGIQHAKGNYVTFVDGDDFVSPLYLETLAAGVKDRPTLVVGGTKRTRIQASNTAAHEQHVPLKPKEVKKNDFIEDIAYNRISESAWGKLAPRSVYTQDFFPEGKIYEDLATIGKLVSGVEQYCVTESPLYYYVMRPGSIVHKPLATMKQISDYLEALDQCDSWLQQVGASSDGRLFRRALSYIRIHELVTLLISNDTDGREIDRAHRNYIKSNLRALTSDPNSTFAEKVRFILFVLSPKLHDIIKSGYIHLVQVAG